MEGEVVGCGSWASLSGALVARGGEEDMVEMKRRGLVWED